MVISSKILTCFTCARMTGHGPGDGNPQRLRVTAAFASHNLKDQGLLTTASHVFCATQ